MIHEVESGFCDGCQELHRVLVWYTEVELRHVAKVALKPPRMREVALAPPRSRAVDPSAAISALAGAYIIALCANCLQAACTELG